MNVKQKYIVFDCILILGIAAFLRFYLIHTTEFDSDQVILFRMAYDAVHYGLFPVTSNVASVGIPHPPGMIYLYMIPALFSANPVGGALLVGACATAAVVLTYLFACRYFGRAAGLVAALLYATASIPLGYARFIWQPNLMPLFLVLYLFALFRGVYDRRPGWLIFALTLLGMLYQAHPTGGILAVLLLVALLLAPRTVRWYDWLIALVPLMLIFLPYLLYGVMSGFSDLRAIFSLAGRSSTFDTQVFMFYQLLLSPFGSVPIHPNSIVRQIAPALSWLRVVSPALALLGGVLVGGCAWRASREAASDGGKAGVLAALLSAWRTLRADPARCAMVLLLVWQVVPLLLLFRHQVDLHAQYLFILLPGPFLLIALCLTWSARWLRMRWPGRKIGFGAVWAFSAVLIGTQLVGSVASVLDNAEGNYYDNVFRPYHNSIYSMQQALAATEQVARERHIQRIYITSDKASYEALNFLVPQMERPATLFSTPDCFVLPAPTAGPAVLLTNPYNPLTDVILRRFTSAELVATLPRIAGDPYKLYIVSTKPPATGQEAFPQQLALADSHVETLKADGGTWLATSWQMQSIEQPAFRTSYSYGMTATAGEERLTSTCKLNAMQSGDQLIVAWELPQTAGKVAELKVQAEFAVTTPHFASYGPLRADMYRFQTATRQLFAVDRDAEGVTLAVA